jgi:hypothetical protein
VLGLFYYEEEGQNFQNDTSFNCGTAVAPCTAPTAATSFLHQKYDSTAIYANRRFPRDRSVPHRGRHPADTRTTIADTMPVVE